MSAASPLGDMIEDGLFDAEPTFGEPIIDPEVPDWDGGSADTETFPPIYSEASERVIKAGNRARGAVGYERKVNDILHNIVGLTVQRPATVVDAGTILLAGDKLSQVWGDAAAENDQVARVIDFLDGGSMNPLVAAIVSTLPVVLQIGRNHEAQLETLSRISLPFTKGRVGINIPTRFKIRFGGRYRDVITHDTELVYDQAFKPAVRDRLAKQGLRVAEYAPKHRPS